MTAPNTPQDDELDEAFAKLEMDLRMGLIQARSDARENVHKPKGEYYETALDEAKAALTSLMERRAVEARIDQAKWYTETATAMYDDLYDGKKTSAQLYLTFMRERLTELELAALKATEDTMQSGSNPIGEKNGDSYDRSETA